MLKDSELFVTKDNKIYHLDLRGEDIADDVLVVGDPDRVALISKYFDKIELKAQHREFVTHTGTLNGKRLTAMSTGIGVGCVDIAVTELDALANIDFKERAPRPNHRTLNIVRLGTCGSLQADVPVDSLIVTTHAIGMDGLLDFYQDTDQVNDNALSGVFIRQTNWPSKLPYPYSFDASPELLAKFKDIGLHGITATALGFYGAQGRRVRLEPAIENLNEKLANFSFDGMRILNYEMEASALYGLSALLGHNHLTICTTVANRVTGEFTKNDAKSIDDMIKVALGRLTA